MSDEYDPENDPESDSVVPMKRKDIRALEKNAGKFTEAQARAEAAERKLAFAEAGINLSDPKLSYFVKGYEGDLTAEAIQAEAQKAGFLAPSDDAQQAEQDAAALGRMADGAANANPVSTGAAAAVDRALAAPDRASFYAALGQSDLVT